jgi:hypothetical protein
MVSVDASIPEVAPSPEKTKSNRMGKKCNIYLAIYGTIYNKSSFIRQLIYR